MLRSVKKKIAFSEVRQNNFLMESTGTSQFLNLKRRVKDTPNLSRNLEVRLRGNSDLSHLPGCN